MTDNELKVLVNQINIRKGKLCRTWFKTTMVITYYPNGRISYWGTRRDYDNIPKDLMATATEYSYIQADPRNYSKSKIHTVKVKRYNTKDYE